MSDEPRETVGAPLEDADAGEPVRELAALAEPVPPDFVEHVLDGVNRRQTVAQAIEVSWWGITGMFMEFVGAFLRTLGVREDHDREN